MCKHRDILTAAMRLRSEDGENVEYDRALVELVAALHGWGSERHPLVRSLLDIPEPPRFRRAGPDDLMRVAEALHRVERSAAEESADRMAKVRAARHLHVVPGEW